MIRPDHEAELERIRERAVIGDQPERGVMALRRGGISRECIGIGIVRSNAVDRETAEDTGIVGDRDVRIAGFECRDDVGEIDTACVLERNRQVDRFARIDAAVIVARCVIDVFCDAGEVRIAASVVENDIIGEDLRRFNRPSAALRESGKGDLYASYVIRVDAGQVDEFIVNVERIIVPERIRHRDDMARRGVHPWAHARFVQ